VKSSLSMSFCLSSALTCLMAFSPAMAQEAVAPAPQPASDQNQPQSQSETASGLPHDRAWRFNTYMENDSAWLKPNADSDRWYTNGLKIEFTHQPGFAQDEEFQNYLPFAKQFGPANVALGYHAGQLMFTPRHIKVRTPQYDDRPFAGYLFGGAFLQRANKNTIDHFQVDLGIIGPSSLAGDAQDLIHRNIAGDDPRGWRHQIRDEPAFQTYLRKKWKFDAGSIQFGEEDSGRKLQFQIIPEAGIALGTVYRHVEAGATLRAGFILPDDFGPGYIANPVAATGGPTPKGWSGYAFINVAGKGVEHNVFFGDSDFRSNEVEVAHRPFIAQASAGISVNYRWEKTSLQFTYSQTYMTREFKDQNGTPAFGALLVSLTHEF